MAEAKPMIRTWEEAEERWLRKAAPAVEIRRDGDWVFVWAPSKYFARLEYRPLRIPFTVFELDLALETVARVRELVMSQEHIA
jgi:hypothetical protein